MSTLALVAIVISGADLDPNVDVVLLTYASGAGRGGSAASHPLWTFFLTLATGIGFLLFVLSLVPQQRQKVADVDQRASVLYSKYLLAILQQLCRGVLIQAPSHMLADLAGGWLWPLRTCPSSATPTQRC